MPETKSYDIIKKGEIPEGVYLITSGEVLVGNRSRVYTFFKLPAFSFFGEINLLFGIKTRYCYFYEKSSSVSCFFIPKADFLEVCQKYPGSAKAIRKRALLRRKAFKQYKINALSKIIDSKRDTNIKKRKDIYERLHEDL